MLEPPSASQRREAAELKRPLLVASLALQFLLELAALAALGYWGSTSGDGTFAHVALAIAAPVLAAVVWGMFGFPRRRFTSEVRGASCSRSCSSALQRRPYLLRVNRCWEPFSR